MIYYTNLQLTGVQDKLQSVQNPPHSPFPFVVKSTVSVWKTERKKKKQKNTFQVKGVETFKHPSEGESGHFTL